LVLEPVATETIGLVVVGTGHCTPPRSFLRRAATTPAAAP
jgi:hypothetical protein